jgi:hypothetical protein
MGCIYKSAPLSVPADAAWRVIDRYTRSEVHIFSMSAGERQEGDYRVVTMPDGAEVRELNISVDPQLRRAAYTIPQVPGAEHHHAVMQIVEDGAGHATLLWVTDIRPDKVATAMAPLYDGLFEELKAAVEAD